MRNLKCQIIEHHSTPHLLLLCLLLTEFVTPSKFRIKLSIRMQTTRIRHPSAQSHFRLYPSLLCPYYHYSSMQGFDYRCSRLQRSDYHNRCFGLFHITLQSSRVLSFYHQQSGLLNFISKVLMCRSRFLKQKNK